MDPPLPPPPPPPYPGPGPALHGPLPPQLITISPEEIEQQLLQYRERVQQYRITLPKDKNSFLVMAAYQSDFDSNTFNYYAEAIRNRVKNQSLFAALLSGGGNKGDRKLVAPDFASIQLMRFLYLETFTQPEPLNAQEEILQMYRDFPFWPGESAAYDAIRGEDFWSENHILMCLSSGHLYYQKAETAGYHVLAGDRETNALLWYLSAHCKFDGFYESFSVTYLPYTFCALLNLYDFSENPDIRNCSAILLDKIVSMLMIVTNKQGVCRLACTTRSYKRSRLDKVGHNINQFINLILGFGEERVAPKIILDFMLTSRWEPDYQTVLTNYRFTGYTRLNFSHRLDDTKEIYKGVPDDEVTPFFWSAGLITHPKFFTHTRDYISKFRLHTNPELILLGLVNKTMLDAAAHFSEAQKYTDLNINVYKTPGREGVLSSLDMYNVGQQTYQQLLWMANVSGVGVWSQSGGDHGDMQRFAPERVNPAVSQKENVLVASYITPKNLRNAVAQNVIIRSYSFVYWPSKFFDEEYRMINKQLKSLNEAERHDECNADKCAWWFARKGEVYVGVFCNKETSLERTKREDSKMKISREEEYMCPRRVCYDNKQTWMCVVGDVTQYQTLRQFVVFCRSIRLEVETKKKKKLLTEVEVRYTATVEVPGAFTISHVYPL